MVQSLTPMTFPSPKNGGFEMHPRTNFAMRAATWRMMEDIDKISFAYKIISRAMSPFAKLLCPLLF